VLATFISVRGSSLLSFKPYDLHTTDAERNHNIRIPGFASDMTSIALTQAGAAHTTQSAQSTKKGAEGTQNSFRAHRLAQVAQAKREAKPM
jgi:transcription initiation factor TFIID subunit 12